MSKFFDELMESVQQMDEIVRGERRPSREFRVDALQVKEIRKATGLTQAKFAALIDVQLGTLRNWEQGRRWADHDVTVPTLFVYGADDPSFGFFPDWEERMKRRVPGLQGIVQIDGAGHFVQQETPHVFNETLLGFLRSFG